MMFKEFPLFIAIVFFVLLGGMWWESGGATIARHALVHRRWGLIAIGWMLLLAPLLMLGYILDLTLSAWYIFCALLGATICLGLVKVIVDSTTVDLNTATEQELAAIPLIDSALAHTIVTYRDEQGGFQSIVELQQLLESDLRLFRHLEEYVRVGPMHEQRKYVSSGRNDKNLSVVEASGDCSTPLEREVNSRTVAPESQREQKGGEVISQQAAAQHGKAGTDVDTDDNKPMERELGGPTHKETSK